MKPDLVVSHDLTYQLPLQMGCELLVQYEPGNTGEVMPLVRTRKQRRRKLNSPSNTLYSANTHSKALGRVTDALNLVSQWLHVRDEAGFSASSN